MYDDNFGMGVRKSSNGRQAAWKALVQCYRNDEKSAADLQIVQQPSPEKRQEKEA
jgi:hypothetical protein